MVGVLQNVDGDLVGFSFLNLPSDFVVGDCWAVRPFGLARGFDWSAWNCDGVFSFLCSSFSFFRDWR